jgi:uncharacterized membrane protein YhaH (DUF805 family)
MSVHRTGGTPPIDQPYPGAPFGEAYKRFWKKGFTFTGRASRSEYWKAYLLTTGAFTIVYLVTVITIGVVAGVVSESGADVSAIGVLAGSIILLAFLYALVCLVPAIAVSVRRLHDTNQSGLMYLLTFIPFVGGIILIVMLCQPANPQGSRFDVRRASSAAPPPVGYAQPAPPRAFGAAPPAPPGSGGVPPLPPAFGTPVDDIDDRTYIPPAAPVTAGYPVSAAAPISAVPGAAPLVPPLPPTPLPLAVPAADSEAGAHPAPSVAARWALELADGRSIPVSDTVYLGRDPIADAAHPGAELVPVDDPARSMSKTHARVGVNGAAIEVTDLHSTNGTRIEPQGAPAITAMPGVPHAVPAGSAVVLGDYVVRVRRTGR